MPDVWLALLRSYCASSGFQVDGIDTYLAPFPGVLPDLTIADILFLAAFERFQSQLRGALAEAGLLPFGATRGSSIFPDGSVPTHADLIGPKCRYDDSIFLSDGDPEGLLSSLATAARL